MNTTTSWNNSGSLEVAAEKIENSCIEHLKKCIYFKRLIICLWHLENGVNKIYNFWNQGEKICELYFWGKNEQEKKIYDSFILVHIIIYYLIINIK